MTYPLLLLEDKTGFEPANQGVAVPCLNRLGYSSIDGGIILPPDQIDLKQYIK